MTMMKTSAGFHGVNMRRAIGAHGRRRRAFPPPIASKIGWRARQVAVKWLSAL